MFEGAGINRSEAEDERALRERRSNPLGLEFCTVASRGAQRSVNRGIGGQGYGAPVHPGKERKLMCSVGDKPTEVKVRSLVA